MKIRMRIETSAFKILLLTGVILALFVGSCTLSAPLAHADEFDLVRAPKVSLFEKIIDQMNGVFMFAAQAIQAVVDIGDASAAPDLSSEVFVQESGTSRMVNAALSGLQNVDSGSLAVNVPFSVANSFIVTGQSNLAGTTVEGALSVIGLAELSSANIRTLTVRGPATLSQLSVQGMAVLNSVQISSTADVQGLLNAHGGIATHGADVDLADGQLYASNVVNEIIAGSSNVSISGTPNAPIISVRRDTSSTPNLEKVRARGGCAECLTDSDIVSALTINAGVIDATAVGLSAAAAAAFTDVTIGSTTATSTLSVYGSAAFDGGINVTSGCVAVNGVCIVGGIDQLANLSDVDVASTTSGDILLFNGTDWMNVATSSLGFGEASFLNLTDTPDTYIANALLFANTGATALTQSADLVFDGTRLGIGTSSPIDTLSINGAAGILGQQALRFYDADSTAHVGFRATTSLAADVLWTLPSEDGGMNQILVTDGLGNLRFDDVESIGGGSDTYLGLSDTADTFLNKAIPYVATNTLAFSPDFVFDGQYLGIGTDAPTAELTVRGSVSFGPDDLTPGFTYTDAGNKVGIGTTQPDERLTLEGGSFLQRGAAKGNFYIPTQTGSLDLPGNGNDVVIIGSYAYVAMGSGGDEFRVIDISDREDPIPVNSLDLPANANALTIFGDYAYVVTDLSAGEFRIIDISDPAVPVPAGTVNLPTTAFDVSIQGRYAYVVTAGTGDDFHVIDISDPQAPYAVSSFDLPAGVNSVHVEGRYAYIVMDTFGDEFRVVDISDPYSPSVVGTEDLPASGYEVVVQGNFAYAVSASDGDDFHVIDISDPTSPDEVGSANLSSTAQGVSVAGMYAYVTTSGSGDDLHVLNISDPTNPVEVGSLELASGTGLAVIVVGTNAYVVTSSLGDDLHVIDISGIDVQSAFVHSFQSGSFSTLGNANIAGSISLGSGLRSGSGGLQTDGGLVVQGTGPSFILGDLAIGTSTPSHKLSVSGDMHLTGSYYDSSSSAGLAGYVLQSTGTSTQWMATSTLGFSSYFDASSQLATILSDETGTGSLVFSEDPVFSGTLAAESATVSSGLTLSGTGSNIALGSNFLSGDGNDEGIFISATGEVGIGTTTPAQRLTVEGTIQSSDLLGGQMSLSTDAQGNIIRTPSDSSLKTDVVTIEGALEKLLALRGVSYAWLDTDRFGEQTEIGFIAQEVDLILPEVVSKGGEYWSLNTSNILAVVVEAFKELWVKVQGNTQEIETLKERVEVLEAELQISVTPPAGDANSSESQASDSNFVNTEAPDASTTDTDSASSTATSTGETPALFVMPEEITADDETVEPAKVDEVDDDPVVINSTQLPEEQEQEQN